MWIKRVPPGKITLLTGTKNREAYTLHIPIWIFHGTIDNVINPWPDRSLIKVLQDGGAKNAKYTEYPGVMHNSWVNAFAEPDLLPWLFSFKR